MGSGMLFVYYIFQISYLEAYKEFEYLVIFLIALSFRDLLPVIVDFTVDVATSKLKQLDNKGTFESDDEIGFFFTEIQKLQKLLSDIFETEMEKK